MRKVKEESVFVTKAVVDTIEEALGDTTTFHKLDTSVEDNMIRATESVKRSVIKEHEEGRMDNWNRLLVTGLNAKGNMVTSPVFRTQAPYVYPLFKIHKLSQQRLDAGEIPPARLVHASREGPFYRLEKWLAPELTTLSRQYCGTEYILDSDDLLVQVDEWRENIPSGTKLFTLDVIALYPSINPGLALEALDDALRTCRTPPDVATTVRNLTTIILKESFVTFRGSVYKGVKGIPTGNCILCQIADITLRYLLFVLCPDAVPTEAGFWRRFIDDILGLWRGTERGFNRYLTQLNSLTEPFGISFGDSQIGHSVSYLDIRFTLLDNELRYQLHRKETDARLFLNTDSYHPEHVFRSVVFSQMIRVVNRNSNSSPLKRDLDELKRDLEKSGHVRAMLDELEPLAKRRATEEIVTLNRNSGRTLVYRLKFYKGVEDLKEVVKDCQESIDLVTGEKTRVIFALKKNTSIGSIVVRNRALSIGEDIGTLPSVSPPNQRCGTPRCKTCPLIFENPNNVFINGIKVKFDMRLTCKSAGVIYVCQCTICDEAYVGQTHQEFHRRINGHRSCFKFSGKLEFEKSALSFHSFNKHRRDDKNAFDLRYFKVGLIRSAAPRDLDRAEDYYISQFNTRLTGINRMVVSR